MKTKRTLNELYSFGGFRALSRLKGIFGDSSTRIVTLMRRQKKASVQPAQPSVLFSTIAGLIASVIWTVAAHGFSWSLNIDVCYADPVKP